MPSADDTRSGDRPLEGTLVVSLEQAVAAPMCSALIANAGARVTKVERPKGDFARDYDDVVHGESAYFVWLNAAKESVRIDLTDAADCVFLHRMIGKADVFIQNLAPGAAARRGFGSPDLRAANPRLITVDISGYGESGSYKDMKAYDLLVQGETGLASITGVPEAPGRIGVSVCDIACGMYAYSGVLEALIRRAKTGDGDAIAVSLFDAVANWMTVPLLHHEYGGAAPRRSGLKHPSIAPYGTFACADGKTLLIAVQNQREWRDFCSIVLEDPPFADAVLFATNVARVANRLALDSIISEQLSQIGHDELLCRLDKARIAFGRLNSVEDLSTHPQLRRIHGASPSGPVELVAHAVRSAAWQPASGAIPALGAHDISLRTEFS